ncbi:hypothetical protein QYE76_019893 [Lolium multiflorum]|uniref:Transposase (putative) gypsy type domain-containing protein n=1 Tax=Lolium multiflorum TaxID=4521 RepID=A0AAD8VQU0_LOLMU|nr:hypothetical protein QYE76_019893 [Lolium multiflorum]
MGKKRGSTSSGATASAPKANLDWTASTITKRDESKMRSMGLIPFTESDFVHPGSASRPEPPKGFTVMFMSFLYHGLSLPAHEFLRCLLFSYGIQLWQLTPNSILHLSIFITVGNEGPHVVGGVGFIVRKEVNYFNFLMRESVQGWRQKWFYLRDIPATGHRSNMPPFEDVLEATPKKSWQNALTAEESEVADQLYEKILDLKSAGGQTMWGTEVVALFLKRRVQPVMSRAHGLWMYAGTKDKSSISSTELSEDDLRDEVRRLTCFNQKDFIAITSVRVPFDLKHLPSEASTLACCYPPTPESGATPEDDDASEENEDNRNALEDSDASGGKAPEEDALLASQCRRKINEDLIATAESSPSRQDDDDADATPSPAPTREASAPLAIKRSSGFFAEEDELMSISSDDDDDVPLSKRAKVISERAELAKESIPLATESAPTNPSLPRKNVTKVKASPEAPSASTSTPLLTHAHPIQAAIDTVIDFADQFGRLEVENAQLHEAAKSSYYQLQEAKRLAADAQNENMSLKEELKTMKKKLNEEQDLKLKAYAEADKKEGVLRESIESLLNTADMPIDHTSKLRMDSMLDALTFAVESSGQIQSLLTKAKGALSKLFSLIFPKLDQNKTLGELADAFYVDFSNGIEILKRRSRLYGSVLTFQLLMGHGFGSDLELLSKAPPVDANGCPVDLDPFKQSSQLCANRLLKLVDDEKKKIASESAPSSSAQT